MTEQTETFEQRARRLVEQNVQACMSGVVYALCQGVGKIVLNRVAPNDLADLVDQAVELVAPVADWEEAARQAGWQIKPNPKKPESLVFINDSSDNMAWATVPDWQELCSEFSIDPYDREVFEHWAVSTYLAELLLAVGEKVDLDFGGLCVWARTTTGQVIWADSCIAECLREQDRRYAAAVAPSREAHVELY